MSAATTSAWDSGAIFYAACLVAVAVAVEVVAWCRRQ